MTGFTESLEEKADQIIKSNDNNNWDNSIPAVLKREIALAANQIDHLRKSHKYQNKGFVQAVSGEKIRNGYQYELQITPPAATSKSRIFTDIFIVNLKGGQELRITCYGHFPMKNAKSSK